MSRPSGVVSDVARWAPTEANIAKIRHGAGTVEGLMKHGTVRIEVLLRPLIAQKQETHIAMFAALKAGPLLLHEPHKGIRTGGG